jgi:hypothetical protein
LTRTGVLRFVGDDVSHLRSKPSTTRHPSSVRSVRYDLVPLNYGCFAVRGPLGGWGMMMNYLATVRIQREYATRGYAITAASLSRTPSMEKVYPYAKPFG